MVDLEPKLLSYEDFHPFAELNTADKDNNILTLHLPGFKKEQIVITVARPSHKIRIQGVRDENKRQQFNQAYKIPQNSNLNKIQAQWENQFLKIIMPKEIVTAAALKDQAALKIGKGKQIMISAGFAALIALAALAGAALGPCVSYIIGSKS